MNAANVNPYMVMPIDRVRSDATAGVRLAVEAWRARDPDGATRELHPVVEPGHEQEQADRTRRILAAVGDYQKKPRHLRHGHKIKASK